MLNAMQLVDGGGAQLPHPISQLRKLLVANPIGFEFRCKSYILGLAYYGSVTPVHIAFQKKTDIQLHTIVKICLMQSKIDEVVKTLKNIAEQNSQTTQIVEP